MKGRDLWGSELEVQTPDGARRFRFLDRTEPLPENEAFVVAIHPKLRQTDIGVDGIAYGYLSSKELQDVETGRSSVNFRVRRPGATTSFRLSEGEEDDLLIGVSLDGES